jgi:acyl-CoA thioester hydrolase
LPQRGGAGSLGGVMISATVPIRVRYAETDGMSVAYHANYLTWFEVARTQLLEDIGVTYRSLEEAGFLLPVVEANLRYLAPSRYDDRLEVLAKVVEPPRARIRIEYEVRRDGRLLTTGYTVHAFMSREGLPLKPPQIVQDAFAKAFAEAAKQEG